LTTARQLLGAVLVLGVLLDIFATVMYARMGSGIISYRVARVAWRAFRTASTPFGTRRRTILAFCGPVILVLLIGVWTASLTLGNALIIHPRLGTAVTATSGPTPTDFVSALYVGASSMAIIGSGGFEPRTAGFRLLYIFNSLVG
jgi:hypothetical protein